VAAEALEGGGCRHRDRGRLLERQAGRLGGDDRHRHRHVLGEAAVAVVEQVGVDRVAGLEPGNAAAHRLDLPGDVDPEDLLLGSQQPQGGPGERRLAPQHMPVGSVDRCCQHLDQGLPGVRDRLVDLGHPKALRWPIPLIDERLHDCPSSLLSHR
jgi:hypothetical protein